MLVDGEDGWEGMYVDVDLVLLVGIHFEDGYLVMTRRSGLVVLVCFLTPSIVVQIVSVSCVLARLSMG
jgi:hypothetical protein